MNAHTTLAVNPAAAGVIPVFVLPPGLKQVIGEYEL